jgi:hypothetical protein
MTLGNRPMHSTRMGRGRRPRPMRVENRRNRLYSGGTISRLGGSMAPMLNAGKSIVSAFAAHIRMR